MMAHDVIAFHVVAAGGGVRHIGDREKLMRDAQFLQVGREELVVLVVEALRAIPDEDVQCRVVFARRKGLREIPRVVAERQEAQRVVLVAVVFLDVLLRAVARAAGSDGEKSSGCLNMMRVVPRPPCE
jgi:hypothetical protein